MPERPAPCLLLVATRWLCPRPVPLSVPGVSAACHSLRPRRAHWPPETAARGRRLPRPGSGTASGSRACGSQRSRIPRTARLRGTEWVGWGRGVPSRGTRTIKVTDQGAGLGIGGPSLEKATIVPSGSWVAEQEGSLCRGLSLGRWGCAGPHRDTGVVWGAASGRGDGRCSRRTWAVTSLLHPLSNRVSLGSGASQRSPRE